MEKVSDIPESDCLNWFELVESFICKNGLIVVSLANKYFRQWKREYGMLSESKTSRR